MIEHTLDLQPSSSETNISEQEILFVKFKGLKNRLNFHGISRDTLTYILTYSTLNSNIITREGNCK